MERLDANTLVKLAAADVNPVRQRTQFTCMATSMMMCLQANGVTCNEDEVNEVMGARAMRGAAWEDAIACAQHYGMKTVLMCPTSLTQIKRWTDMGVPVIIAWNPEKREWAHASVVFDVDDYNNVHVADPNIPNPDKTVRIVPEDEFYGLWAEKHSNGYLIRRTAMAVMPEITEDGRQKWASTRTAMAKEFETMSMPELEKEVSKAFRGSKHNSKQMMLELPDGRLVMFSRSGRGPSAKTKIDIYKSEGGKPSPVKKDIAIKSVADAVSKIKSNKTASMDEQAISKIHPQMAKALASGIRGARADTNDFWSSGVSLPRDIAHGMYLQVGTQMLPKETNAYVSVWTPMMTRGNEGDWMSLYAKIRDILKKAQSAMGRLGKVQVYENDKAFKVWLVVDPTKLDQMDRTLVGICKQLGPQIGKAVASHAASPEHMGHFANLSVHPKVQEIMDNNPWNSLELHPKVAEISVEATLLSRREIERALKRSGLNFEYTRNDGGAFMVWGLGPMLSDRAEIALDHKGGRPMDATRWRAVFDGRDDHFIESLSDLNKLVSAMNEKRMRWEKMMGRAATDETTAMWDGLTPHASVTTATKLLPEDPTTEIEEDFESLVQRMMLAAKAEDDGDEDEDDKEAKFERGEDVPLSKMPKKLQDNAKNPPPSVQKVKEKIKSKKASVELKGDRLMVRMMDQDELPPKGTVMAALDDQWVVTDVATVHNAATGDQVHGHVLVALRESEFDKLAARAPSGMYGYTKRIERDCQASVRKLHRQAVKLARTAVRRDGKVADFWGVHSKRGRSKAARMLLAALEANHRLASEQGKTVPMDKEATDKEAAYGYYGFRAKTARRGLSACQALREEAGIVAASLHHRRTNLHAKITGFLEMHSKKGKCAGSRLLYDAYPDSAMKFASATTEDQPNDVGWLLSWEPES